eukprot:CAMPEP_0201563644 /NCGR_PEP_ID=MMETSP0190_2-20130828/785_1 /ASSEMBLY_ACC=CAM_ASM_000263 /TAXON_ID=37353 /ORGANISM="Rosalina sp." /LENGTH=141 /DNA_ID=CAMNT_0047978683 /DNA_START=43 /DNA_END=465 /DNA_ORIENTATION=-
MQDWLEILKEEEDKAKNKSTTNQDDQDVHLELPEPVIIHLNDDGSLRKEITYEYDKDDPNKIYRVERIIQIQDIQLSVSEAAINRKRNWTKFGQVADIPKGQTERGKTIQRPTNPRGINTFIWTFGGKNKEPKSNNNQSSI